MKKKNLENIVQKKPSWAEHIKQEKLMVNIDRTHCRIREPDKMRHGELDIFTTGSGYGKVLGTSGKSNYKDKECALGL